MGGVSHLVSARPPLRTQCQMSAVIGTFEPHAALAISACINLLQGTQVAAPFSLCPKQDAAFRGVAAVSR